MAQEWAWGIFWGLELFLDGPGNITKEKSHSHGILLIDQICYFLDGSVVALTR